MSIRSQWRTLVAPFSSGLLGTRHAPGRPWRTIVADAGGDRPVALTGIFHAQPDATAVVVIAHGLGGSAAAHYARRATIAAADAGMASLRFSFRGADRAGEDIYHAGLTDDFRAVIASPEVAPFERVYVLGYSLGGHTALLAATQPLDPRVRAVAAIQPPLDLARGQVHLDRTRFYRNYILRGLREIYRAAHERGRIPTIDGIDRIRTIREWDDRIVAPHFGFDGADDYYARTSVGPRLGELRVPAIAVESRHDPLIPERLLRPWLEPAPPRLTVHWIPHAGHGASTGREDLGIAARPGLERQLIAWLLAQDA